ncbi:MAG: hypothetical protein H7Z37_03190, partial [Pyrinomonadaceae bacterium]|nr:hypothetical protein [Pyrinomonadaceae bacterium]
APQKNSYFKRALNGYDSQYGSKDDYREQYRRAFLRGYEAGYSNPNGDVAPTMRLAEENPSPVPPKN